MAKTESLPFYCWLGIPSCVLHLLTRKITPLLLGVAQTLQLPEKKEIHFLAEDECPGEVIYEDPEIMFKTKASLAEGKPKE